MLEKKPKPRLKTAKIKTNWKYNNDSTILFVTIGWVSANRNEMLCVQYRRYIYLSRFYNRKPYKMCVEIGVYVFRLSIQKATHQLRVFWIHVYCFGSGNMVLHYESNYSFLFHCRTQFSIIWIFRGVLFVLLFFVFISQSVFLFSYKFCWFHHWSAISCNWCLRIQCSKSSIISTSTSGKTTTNL